MTGDYSAVALVLRLDQECRAARTDRARLDFIMRGLLAHGAIESDNVSDPVLNYLIRGGVLAIIDGPPLQ